MATYFGKVCSQHPELNGERSFGSRRCLGCGREKAKEYRAKNKEKVKAYSAAYLPEWRKKNADKVREDGRVRMMEWRASNPGRVKELNALPERVAERSAARAPDKRAMVSWADEFIINQIYELAELRRKMTGISWVVDHIVPFKSDQVCGLHCEANMQIITRDKNSSKGNRNWPNMWK